MRRLIVCCACSAVLASTFTALAASYTGIKVDSVVEVNGKVYANVAYKNGKQVLYRKENVPIETLYRQIKGICPTLEMDRRLL